MSSDEEVWNTLAHSLRKRRGQPRDQNSPYALNRTSVDLERIDTPPSVRSPNLRRAKYKVIPPVKSDEVWTSDGSEDIIPISSEDTDRSPWRYSQKAPNRAPNFLAQRRSSRKKANQKKTAKMAPIAERSFESTDQRAPVAQYPPAAQPPPPPVPFNPYTPYVWPLPYMPYGAPYAPPAYPAQPQAFTQPIVQDTADKSNSSKKPSSQSLQPLLFQSAIEFYEETDFARKFVNNFIGDLIQKELLPEIIAECRVEAEQERAKDTKIQRIKDNLFHLRPESPVQTPALVISPEIETHGTPAQYSPTPAARRGMPVPVPRSRAPVANTLQVQAAAGRGALEGIMAEVVDEESTAVAKEAAEELVMQFLRDLEAESVFDEFMEDIIRESIKLQLPLIKQEILIEQVIEDNILQTEIDKMVEDVAIDSLRAAGKELLRDEYFLIKEKAEGKLLDSLLLDYLTKQLAVQGEQLSAADAISLAQDGLMLDKLLEEHRSIVQHAKPTTACRPILRFHQKAIIDQALPIMLNALLVSVDEDMKDLDEYEFGYDIDR